MGTHPLVAQICNLPYRRVALGRASEVAASLGILSGLRIENPRYSSVQLCATSAGLTVTSKGIASRTKLSYTMPMNCPACNRELREKGADSIWLDEGEFSASI